MNWFVDLFYKIENIVKNKIRVKKMNKHLNEWLSQPIKPLTEEEQIENLKQLIPSMESSLEYYISSITKAKKILLELENKQLLKNNS